MNHFDVVIVGAGSAGCALAARLSADPDRRVLLLEAGMDWESPGEPSNPLLDASRMVGAADGHHANWALPATLTGSRTITVARGKVMGGSSTINGGLFVRATREDFDGWAAAGNDEWSFAAVLPFLRQLEDDRDYPDSEFHGTGGPMPVSRVARDEMHPVSGAFIEACSTLGFPEEADKNAPGTPGFGPIPRNVVNGVRINTAMAYIAPIHDLPNLTVECGVTARRVVFDGQRAVGVEAEHAGSVESFHGSEIVLSAGAVMSAHLLLVSGVGPASTLRRHGIPVVVDLPGVGTRGADHPQIFLGVDWDRQAQPRVISGVAEVALDTIVDGVPVSVMPYLSSMAELVPTSRAAAPEPGRDSVVGVLLERTVGSVEIALTSGEPGSRPTIDYHALEAAQDKTRLRVAVELAVSIIDSAAMRDVGVRRTSPSRGADVDQWIDDNVTTAVHLCSTAPMGSDNDSFAVVDQHCRVRGVDGLRVVDTSVLPTAPSRGTAATAVLIGERAGAFFDEAAT